MGQAATLAEQEQRLGLAERLRERELQLEREAVEVVSDRNERLSEELQRRLHSRERDLEAAMGAAPESSVSFSHQALQDRLAEAERRAEASAQDRLAQAERRVEASARLARLEAQVNQLTAQAPSGQWPPQPQQPPLQSQLQPPQQLPQPSPPRLESVLPLQPPPVVHADRLELELRLAQQARELQHVREQAEKEQRLLERRLQELEATVSKSADMRLVELEIRAQAAQEAAAANSAVPMVGSQSEANSAAALDQALKLASGVQH